MADDEVLLVTGIANPRPLQQYLEEVCGSYQLQAFSDHHIFTIDDLRDIKKRFQSIASGSGLILTTEKDAVRLLKFKNELAGLPLYVIPVQHQILFGDAARFNELLKEFVRNFRTVEKSVEYGKEKQ